MAVCAYMFEILASHYMLLSTLLVLNNWTTIKVPCKALGDRRVGRLGMKISTLLVINQPWHDRTNKVAGAPIETTLKCLSIGTPNTTNFPFVPNRKSGYIRCPKI